jgi:transposase
MMSADRRSAMPTAVAERELLDKLWARVAPLIPPSEPSPLGGRPRADDRACFEGVVYVLRSGCRWRDLPPPYPSGPTCWRRHRDWCTAGVWDRLWAAAVAALDAAGGLDLDELFLDTTFVEARRGATRSGKPSAARA